MITHAGDTSNLILDPDLDSYYLMDVVLLALPQTEDRLADALHQGRNFLEAPQRTEQGRIGLAVTAAMLQQADLDRVLLSSQTALLEDPNFYGAQNSLTSQLPPALESYQKAATHFTGLTSQLAQPGGAPVDWEEYFKAGTAARHASFAYWGVAASQLNALLETRIADYAHRRTLALLLSGLALLIAGLLSYALAGSITAPLQGLVESLGPGGTLLGVCVERIAAASRDKFADPEESLIICEELQSHATSMRQAVEQLTAHVRGAGSAALSGNAVGAKSQAAYTR